MEAKEGIRQPGEMIPGPLGSPMKLLLGIFAVIFVVASLIADYKWRQWMAARRPQRHEPVDGGSGSRDRH
jgi:hypothetical protein